MVMPPPEDTLRKSVIDTPKVSTADSVGMGFGPGDPLSEIHLYTIAQFADEIAPWGQLVRLRDILTNLTKALRGRA